jgi:hypothetical protein
VQITYSEHGVGAAGRGWDVPLSYIRDDTTVIRRRPKGNANVAPESREQVSLVLSGRVTDLIFAGTVTTTTGTDSTWIARDDDVMLQVRRQHPNNGQPNDDTWVAYDGQGRTYTFVATAISSAFWCPTGQYISPAFNVLMMFSVMPSTLHLVCPVRPTAMAKRLTINGFWHSAEPRQPPVSVPPDAWISPAAYGPPTQLQPDLRPIVVP